MRYIFGLGALLIFGFIAWLIPPDPSPADPLLGHGYLSFLAGWMLLTIPLGITAAIVAGLWIAFSTGMAKMHKAQHPKVPKNQSLSVSYAPRELRSFPAQTALPAPQPTIDVTPSVDVPSFAQLLDRGLIAPDRPLILGYTNSGMLTGSWRDLYSSAIAGLTGSGKTSTLRLLACQSAVLGARFVVIDPHADAGDESLAATLGPLHASMLCEPADTERSIRDAANLVRMRLDARLRGDKDRTPLLLCIDEFTRLMRSPALAAELTGLVEAIGQEGRKVGIFALLSGQIWRADASRHVPVTIVQSERG